MPVTRGTYTYTGGDVLETVITASVTIQPFVLYARARTYWTFPLDPKPSYPVQTDRQPSVRSGKEGAYEQRAPNGINSQDAKTVTLRWLNISTAEKEKLDDFLRQRGGAGRFKYQLPGWPEVEDFSCPTWTVNLAAKGAGGNFWTLDATFLRRFDLTQG
jgi:phage-related protein